MKGKLASFDLNEYEHEKCNYYISLLKSTNSYHPHAGIIFIITESKPKG